MGQLPKFNTENEDPRNEASAAAMLPTAYISCILMPGINPLVATPPHAAIDTACPRGI